VITEGIAIPLVNRHRLYRHHHLDPFYYLYDHCHRLYRRPGLYYLYCRPDLRCSFGLQGYRVGKRGEPSGHVSCARKAAAITSTTMAYKMQVYVKHRTKFTGRGQGLTNRGIKFTHPAPGISSYTAENPHIAPTLL